MILTGKAKEDFEIYLKKEYDHVLVRTGVDKTHLYNLLLATHIKKTESLLNNVIIEWLDSVELIIQINYGRVSKSWMCSINGEIVENFMPSRKYCTKKAIKKANEIYNNQ